MVSGVLPGEEKGGGGTRCLRRRGSTRGIVCGCLGFRCRVVRRWFGGSSLESRPFGLPGLYLDAMVRLKGGRGGGYRHEFEAVAGVVDEEGEEEEGLDVLDGGCFEGRFGEHVGVERGFELLGRAVGGGLET